MSARSIFDHAPLGATIQFSDGTPRPPARFRNKLAAWESRNSRGRLTRKQNEKCVGNTVLPANFTLHEADHGGGGVVVLRVYRTFSVDSELTFRVIEQPAIGSVRVFSRAGESGELVYLACDREDAETWLKSHGYPDAVLDEVVGDDPATASSEGRAA
ncbi:hypothetical protein OCA5_pHCG300930 (plasmid) [Afipia carboxidovorans OM5]|uniref:Uncharacterized protein n=1 Tax=Afipia carboxidovorans (strain ATCC 49405 / DSM 1227 / KCTC 32145 / OM5) TaxID=504832 RepID=F8C156_AFIC5|nr:hypothetical protein [Afipia carboxidovorans]AEI04538.1 hypothetical protein OCA4_pHCG3B00930 [Afipia carboxidovorans OM4]AEI08166.1 hypothetical protein OCA5_pHCG300930 [Afipia carboxidovorans OM5]